MTVTKKVIAANRRNARKSTGPKTESGKAAASRNAVRHGLYSSSIIVDCKDFSEDSAEYQLLVSSLRDELAPETVFQECIVRKIANCIWRSRRVVAAETAFIMDEIGDATELIRSFRLASACRAKFPDRDFDDLTEEEQADLRARVVALELVPDKSYTLDLTRYEMRLDRQLVRMFQFYQDIKTFSARKPAGKSDPTEPSQPTEPTEAAVSTEPIASTEPKNEKSNPLVASDSTT